MIIRNAGRFTSAGVIGTILMLLGKGTIMASSAFITIVLCQQAYPEIDNPFIPAILIAIFGYLVGSTFLSIFSFSSTAIMHCFLLSEEVGNGRDVPESLKSFLDNCEEKAP